MSRRELAIQRVARMDPTWWIMRRCQVERMENERRVARTLPRTKRQPRDCNYVAMDKVPPSEWRTMFIDDQAVTIEVPQPQGNAERSAVKTYGTSQVRNRVFAGERKSPTIADHLTGVCVDLLAKGQRVDFVSI